MTSPREITMALLSARSTGSTVCPSEVARAIAGEGDWRDAMPAVHAAVDRLVVEGLVRLSWKRTQLPARTGPYRIGKFDDDQSP